MDEFTAARFDRDLKALQGKHYAEGLADPMAALSDLASKYQVNVDTAIEAFLMTSEASPPSVPEN